MIAVVLDWGIQPSPWGMLVLVAACAVGDGSDNASSFGSANASSPTVSATASASGSGSDTDTDDDSGTDGSSSTTDDDSASAGSSSPTSSATTASPASTGDATLTSGVATGMGSDGEQPEDGMYSPCLMATDCVGNNVCMTIDDNGMMSGFCSDAECADATVDCEPTPGGNAVPVCYPAELNGAPNMICALSCANGETCPTPMTCHNLPEGALCS